jgi:hypothetical protein
MSETTEELSTETGENPDISNAEVEQGAISNPPPADEQEDNLAELAPEKLAGMVRDKRKAEANVRGKLRETEAERDKLAEAVTGFRRQAFAEAAKAARVQDSAVDDVLNAVSLEAVLAEDGTIDAGKVSEAVGTLRKSHPHYFKQASSFSAQGGAPGGDGLDASWSDVLR